MIMQLEQEIAAHLLPTDRRVWPPRLIEVLQAGQWRKAQLEAFRAHDTPTMALVLIPPGPDGKGGLQRRWVPRRDIRFRGKGRSQGPPAAPPPGPVQSG
jgi:hypothetical protein